MRRTSRGQTLRTHYSSARAAETVSVKRTSIDKEEASPRVQPVKGGIAGGQRALPESKKLFARAGNAERGVLYTFNSLE